MSNFKDSFLLETGITFAEFAKYQKTIRENFGKNIIWKLKIK